MTRLAMMRLSARESWAGAALVILVALQVATTLFNVSSWGGATALLGSEIVSDGTVFLPAVAAWACWCGVHRHRLGLRPVLVSAPRSETAVGVIVLVPLMLTVAAAQLVATAVLFSFALWGGGDASSLAPVLRGAGTQCALGVLICPVGFALGWRVGWIVLPGIAALLAYAVVLGWAVHLPAGRPLERVDARNATEVCRGTTPRICSASANAAYVDAAVGDLHRLYDETGLAASLPDTVYLTDQHPYQELIQPFWPQIGLDGQRTLRTPAALKNDDSLRNDLQTSLTYGRCSSAPNAYLAPISPDGDHGKASPSYRAWFSSWISASRSCDKARLIQLAGAEPESSGGNR